MTTQEHIDYLQKVHIHLLEYHFDDAASAIDRTILRTSLARISQPKPTLTLVKS